MLNITVHYFNRKTRIMKKQKKGKDQGKSHHYKFSEYLSKLTGNQNSAFIVKNIFFILFDTCLLRQNSTGWLRIS